MVAIATVAIASVFVCASCSKDEAGDEPGDKPGMVVPDESLTKDLTIVLSNDLIEYGEVSITVTQDGKSDVYKSSATSGEETIDFKDEVGNPTSLTGKAINIKGIKLNATLNCAYNTNEKTMPEKMDCSYAYKTVTLGGPKNVISNNGFVMKGLAKERAVDYITRRLELLKPAIAKNPYNEEKQDE